MRQIAFFADIHGNLPALEAVTEDIRRRGIEEIYFLGDMVGKGPSGAEAVDGIRDLCTSAVYGNWDRLVSGNYQGHGGPWFRAQLSEEQLKYLRGLDRDLCLQVAGRTVRCYHGRFTIPHVVMPYDGRKAVQQAQEAVGEANITIMADSHHPFQVMNQGKMLINTGSAGNPCDRVPKASYFILREEGTTLETSHIRLDYDVERAVRLAEQAQELPMQAEYIQELRTGIYMRFKPR